MEQALTGIVGFTVGVVVFVIAPLWVISALLSLF